MLTESIIGMTRRRWRDDRPFAGHTKESLVRKLQNDAVREDVKEQVREELARRAGDPYST